MLKCIARYVAGTMDIPGLQTRSAGMYCHSVQIKVDLVFQQMPESIICQYQCYKCSTIVYIHTKADINLKSL